jgi:hypothetical protein
MREYSAPNRQALEHLMAAKQSIADGEGSLRHAGTTRAAAPNMRLFPLCAGLRRE